ncbi:hypothetical protein [Arthrobacter psychrolactophilus]|nr:hypothetical protein [Arthrobacter psychrolactophilus]
MSCFSEQSGPGMPQSLTADAQPMTEINEGLGALAYGLVVRRLCTFSD